MVRLFRAWGICWLVIWGVDLVWTMDCGSAEGDVLPLFVWMGECLDGLGGGG
jgi:hypothetical protein